MKTEALDLLRSRIVKIDSMPAIPVILRPLLHCLGQPVEQVDINRIVLPDDQESFNLTTGGETTLLVEGDPSVRRMAVEILLNTGYRVLAAPSGADALRMAAEGRLDLPVTDVVMPGMTGPELAERFFSEFWQMRTLFMSGYTDDAIGKHGLRGRAVRLLQKPFTHETLARGVVEALEPVAQASASGGSSLQGPGPTG